MFPHGVLEEQVFRQQPPRYEDSPLPHHVCCLDKAIYGLKQAPHACYSWLSHKLQQLGFVSSKANPSLFIFRRPNVIVFLLIYVGNIIVASSSPRAMQQLLHNLCADFDLGDLHYFLGIEIKKSINGILLTQDKYASDMLKRVGMEKTKPVKTPMANSHKLPLFILGILSPSKILHNIVLLWVHCNTSH